jgi:hypothetical protein
MNFKGLFIGETCTGTGATQTLAGAYTLETGVDTLEFADAYAVGAVIPIVLLASNGVNRIEGEALVGSGTLTITPWVIWNGTTYEIYDNTGFTLPAGTHKIWVGLGGNNVTGINPYGSVHREGNTMQVPDNIVRADSFQDFNGGGIAFFGECFYASPVLFNRLCINIGTAGGAGATIEAGMYKYRERNIFEADCGDPGASIAIAEFDAEVTGTQFASVPLQILPPGRYWSGTWSDDATVTAWRSQERTHSGSWGVYRFNNGGTSSLELDPATGLPADMTGESPAREAPFRAHLVGLGYVAA